MRVYYNQFLDEILLVDKETKHPWGKDFSKHRWSWFQCGATAWSTSWRSDILICKF